MSEPTDSKAPDVVALEAPKRRGGNPLMQRGAPSLNPRGRPRVGQSLAEAIREHFSPETIIEKVEELTRSDDDRVRMVALQFIAERGYGRVITTQAMDAASGNRTLPSSWPMMNQEQRSAYLDSLRMRIRTTNPDEEP